MTIGDCAQDTNEDRWLGRVLDNRYLILEPLGKGGMGAVYRAEHVRIGRSVAIKIVGAPDGDPQWVEQLEREARTVALIGHSNVVRILDFGQLGPSSAFLAMELLEGQCLQALLNDKRSLDLPLTCELMIQVADALIAAHGQGVIHRDIKPANIFICPEDRGGNLAKLLDFGMAALNPGPTQQHLGDTQRRMIFGTPGYLAPELAMGREATFQADVFSLGVTMHQLLSGSPPFYHQDALGAVMRSLEAAPPPLQPCRPDLPHVDEVQRVLLQAMAKKPEQRPSMSDFRAQLHRLRTMVGAPTERRRQRASARRRALVSWVTNADQTVVELSGPIDESTNFDDIGDRICAKEVQLRLGQVTRVNSAGCLRWSRWLGQLVSSGLDVTLHECSDSIVRHALIDSNFCRGLPIISFFAPYYCRHCDLDRRTLHQADSLSTETLSKQPCPICSGPMALDEIESNYLPLLTSDTSALNPPAETQLRLRAEATCRWRQGHTRQLYARELSEHGTFILSFKRVLPPVGSDFLLQLRTQGHRLPWINARVVYAICDAREPLHNGFGVAFTNLAPEVRSTLVDLLPDPPQPASPAVVPAPQGSERRVAPRVALSRRRTARLEGSTNVVRLDNLSMSGALVSPTAQGHQMPWSAGDRLRIELALPPAGQSAVVNATVVRQGAIINPNAPQPDKPREKPDQQRCAIRFDSLDAHGEEVIEALMLNALLPQPAALLHGMLH